jgi:acetylornithine aminotransferase
MAKGMGNGFPIGGILIAPHIHPKHFQLGTTFGGNHLACAAALAVLEVMEEEKLMQNAITVGGYLMKALAEIDVVQNLRGRGLMIGFDLPESHAKLRSRLLNEYRVFTGEAKPNSVRLLPSMALTIEEAELFIDRLQKAIATN